MSVIGRVDDGDSRWYIDPASGAQYESVTRILGASHAKPWLAPWSAKLAAEAAVEHLDLLRELIKAEGPGPAVAWLKDAARRRRQAKADIGSYCHDVIEALILDTPSIPTPPEHLLGPDGTPIVIDGESVDLDAIIDGFLAFNEDFRPVYLLAEATVANVTHAYAGTLDFVARFPTLGDQVGGVDTKTGAVLDEWMNPQLAAYRNTDEIWLNDLGDRAPMMAWDFAAVLHVRTDYKRGYKLLDQPADADAFAWFLKCREILAAVQTASPVRGRPLYPARDDGSQPPMLLEDADGLARFARALDEHTGAMSVVDASTLTVDELLAVPGIGAVSVATIIDGLAPHGLTLTGPLPCPGGSVGEGGVYRVSRKVMAICPTCQVEVSAAKDGTVRFHTSPVAVAA